MNGEGEVLVAVHMRKALDACPCCRAPLRLDGSETQIEDWDGEGLTAIRKVCPSCEAVLTVFRAVVVIDKEG